MGNLLARFKQDDDEPDWDALRARSMYPELIGRTVEADDFTPFWMHCRCRMLVVTSRELAGQGVVCANCRTNLQLEANASAMPEPRAFTRRSERHMTLAVTAFVLLVGCFFGARMMDAPARDPHEPAPYVLD